MLRNFKIRMGIETVSANNIDNEVIEELVINSPIGPILLRANEKFLLFLDFTKKKSGNQTSNLILLKAKSELNEYFSGTLEKFSIPFEARGTEFQKKVWIELQKIPYGKSLSYGELASKVGGKNYARAVGSAVGKNPLAIIIPCHRILAANGIGGFSGGINIKNKLMEIEKIEL